MSHKKQVPRRKLKFRRRIVILAVPPATELDVVGPFQVFTVANLSCGISVSALNRWLRSISALWMLEFKVPSQPPNDLHPRTTSSGSQSQEDWLLSHIWYIICRREDK